MSLVNTAQILLFSLLLATAGTLRADEMQSEASSGQLVQGLVKIEDNRIVYKGKSVKVPYTRKRLIQVFGKPSREIYNTAGNVVIWDDLGLSCYGCSEQEKTPEEFEFMSKEEKESIKYQPYVDSITLHVRKYNPYPDREKKYSHEPRYPFQGKVELDGVELDGTLTFYEFVENRKSKQTILLPENSFSFFIRCKPQPHEVTLHTIRDKYDDDYMSVYSVSIRNIGHYYKDINKCTETFSVAPRPKDQETKDPEPKDQETNDQETKEQGAKEKQPKDPKQEQESVTPDKVAPTMPAEPSEPAEKSEPAKQQPGEQPTAPEATPVEAPVPVSEDS